MSKGAAEELARARSDFRKDIPIATVRPKRWWWPPDRKKARLLTTIMNSAPFKGTIQSRFEQAWKDYILYGKPFPSHVEWSQSELERDRANTATSQKTSPNQPITKRGEQ